MFNARSFRSLPMRFTFLPRRTLLIIKQRQHHLQEAPVHLFFRCTFSSCGQKYTDYNTILSFFTLEKLFFVVAYTCELLERDCPSLFVDCEKNKHSLLFQTLSELKLINWEKIVRELQTSIYQSPKWDGKKTNKQKQPVIESENATRMNCWIFLRTTNDAQTYNGRHCKSGSIDRG